MWIILNSENVKKAKNNNHNIGYENIGLLVWEKVANLRITTKTGWLMFSEVMMLGDGNNVELCKGEIEKEKKKQVMKEINGLLVERKLRISTTTNKRWLTKNKAITIGNVN